VTKLLIVTDAWTPQTNGVVRCLQSVGLELVRQGIDVKYLTPERFWKVPLPTYPEIQLALAPPRAVGDYINHHFPDHIHIATEGPLGFQARLHCDAERFAFTTSYHTRFAEYLALRVPVAPDIPTGLSYAYLRWFHGGAAATLVPTKSVADDLERRDFANLKVWSRGVDRALFSPGPKTCFADLPGPHLLYVGRVAVEKNVEAFLDLDVPGSKIVVGQGPQLEALRAAYPDCHFMGQKTGAELAEIYRSADVFVFPSKTDTFGNVMIEALASGLPVAAYPVMGPVDVLTDPRAGAMDADLATAVRRALTLDRSDAAAHAQKFNWSHCARQLAATLVPAVRAVGHRAA